MICWRCIIKIYKFGMDARIIVYFCCRGSWEPCGLKSSYWPFQRLGWCRGSWEPCGLKWQKCCPTSRNKDVEARESLVDWNGWQEWMNKAANSRGSWEPCGLKFPGSSPGDAPLSSRLVRALWIEISNKPITCLGHQRRGSWEPCGLKSWPRYRRRQFLLVEARESLVDWNSTTGSWKHLCRLYIFTTHLEILYNSQCYKENIFKREGESFYGKRY